MNVTFPYLEPWQADVFNYSTKHTNDKWVVVKAVRQCGKSVLAQLLLIYSSLQKGSSVSLSISPVMAQSRKMFNDVCRIARPLVKNNNASLLEITFMNDSRILFKSSEQGDSLRGETVKGSGILVVDEAAFIPDDIFYNILVPTTNVYKSNIFIFSTPKYQQGFFYSLYNRGLHNDPKVVSFDWTNYDTSKYLDEETLEIYRKQMPRNAFEAEYLGMFISGSGAVFTNFKECAGNEQLSTKFPVWLSVDWGSGQGQDYTVITVGQFNNDIDKIVVSHQIAFNDKNVQETIAAICDAVKELVKQKFQNINVIVEKNSIGNVYYQILIEELDNYERNWNDNCHWRDEIQVDCITFTTTNKSKERIIKQLIVNFEQKTIVLPNDDALFQELAAYDCHINQNGNPIYGNSSKMAAHDDRVMSLAILCDKI